MSLLEILPFCLSYIVCSRLYFYFNSRNIYIYELQKQAEQRTFGELFRPVSQRVQMNLTTMYVFCVYTAMSKQSENLTDLDKKDRNKRHSSHFINVVKGVLFVFRVTLVPVSYLSVHSNRVPGKFIRRLKSLFVQYEKCIRLVRIKEKCIRIAYLYSKCTDCRIKLYIDISFKFKRFFFKYFEVPKYMSCYEDYKLKHKYKIVN